MQRSHLGVFSFRVSCLLRIGLLFALCGTCTAAKAQSEGRNNNHLIVISHGESLHLETYETTPLPEVLRAVCTCAEVRCSGVELLSNDMVPAMVIEGTFLQVFRTLTDGSDVNLEYTHRTAVSLPELALSLRAPLEAHVKQAAIAGGHTHESAGPETSALPILDQVLSVVLPTFDSDPANSAGDFESSAERVETRPASELTLAGANAVEAKPLALLPFPDADGHPMEVDPANSAYLPFPDAEGHLIKIEPASPVYLPFPDQFGNPIPISPAVSGSPFPQASEPPSRR